MVNKQIEEAAFRIIPRKVLLAAYLIVPVLVMVVLLDMFYLGQSLQPYLGIEALYFPVFLFFFLLPHILASFFSFFDREYVRHYRSELGLWLPAVLLATVALLYVDWRLGLAFFFINDVWHGVRQKVGIALILGAKPGRVHTAWTIAPFVMSSLVYVYYVVPEVLPAGVIEILSEILFGCAVLILLLMLAMMWRSAAKVRWYIFLVSMFFLTSYFFVLAGYVFFAFLGFRFIHDVSAFAFYIAHDHNRNRTGYKNWFYKFWSFVPLPILILTPLLSLALAYIVRTATNGLMIGYSVVILLCMSHFYLESAMWKRGTPHRQQVRVQ